MPLTFLHHIKGSLIIIERNRQRCHCFHIYYRIRVPREQKKKIKFKWNNSSVDGMKMIIVQSFTVVKKLQNIVVGPNY